MLKRAAVAVLLPLLSLCLSGVASAQWATNGNTTSTTNNVGVGTAAPAQMFHVHGTGAWAGTRVTTAATGATGGDGVNFGYDDAYGAYVWNREASPLIFSTSNTERMRVDAAGNVGIGTQTPEAKLHVLGAGRFGGPGAGLNVRNTDGWSQIIAVRTGGMQAAFIAVPAVPYNVSNPYWAMGLSSDGSAGWSLDTWDGTSMVNRVRVVPNSGNVGIGTAAPATKLHVAGDIRVDGNINAKYQDVAEWVPSTQKLSAGTVVVLDPERSNHVLASKGSYDTAVAGVVSEKPGLSLGDAGEGKVLVATTGRVKVKVDATRAPIKIGDLIVTSDVEGVAMKSEPVVVGGRRIHAPGTIIGKALEPLAGGTGEILVLLSLQ